MKATDLKEAQTIIGFNLVIFFANLLGREFDVEGFEELLHNSDPE